uniref:S-protein homolog n=1 Tax=Papaver rhoeas TaxID=33128 RepID=O65870_PAPRH|nr:self-incompatibility [Papaver rhoeas]
MKLLYAILFLSFLTLASSRFLPVIEVRIMNKRGNGHSIGIHCRSKDDDLGYHRISDGQQVHFSFRENFFHTTTFNCDIEWDSRRHFNFDSYRAQRDDHGRCTTECLWKTTDEGLYGYDQEHEYWQLYYLAKK